MRLPQFFLTREKFYEQKDQLNQILAEDLARLDNGRRDFFLKKYNHFKIRKNSGFGKDIKVMRFRAEQDRLREQAENIAQHPWFTDLVDKVATSSKHPSKLEDLLLDRIRRSVEAGEDFNQAALVQLLRLIPQRVFTDDSVQRIIRFVRQHSGISEREFLEALEMSSQGLGVLRKKAAVAR
ncbi:hypothetical protein HDU83_007620 [Entophlyctis luteolus]|nr:hypothetical protein HDU83_007620 [Entophlyctis luteolus]KAJ3377165.1 hypothetical protein HDU84_008939 [Entophlyctis sp. JEL0112]